MSLIPDKAAGLEKELRLERSVKGRVRGRNVYWAKEAAVNAVGKSFCACESCGRTCIASAADREKGERRGGEPNMVVKCRGVYVVVGFEKIVCRVVDAYSDKIGAGFLCWYFGGMEKSSGEKFGSSIKVYTSTIGRTVKVRMNSRAVLNLKLIFGEL